uniref:7-carboxy-7-deazaguanine synthase n=1 Tax=uncultured Poseidoniia archaeon TaxID=1697135 RepID=A0A1B1TDD1_9ARCH|nr:Organic radical activating enzymes famuily protein [uncultured Candidatus Thalassoarchaea sp.]
MAVEKSYPIVEIFNSVQGEGYHTGTPSIFIRFGGCNLQCSWCDTDFSKWDKMTVSEIMAVLSKWDTKRVIFTGGEPAMQKLRPLSDELHSKGYNIAIETNGTIELEEGLVDWICVSPKDMLYPEFSIKQRKGNELKVVYTGQDLGMYDNLKDGFENLFLQPCYDEAKDPGTNGKTFHSTFDMVMQNPGWNLSLQTHKWMGVD